MRAKAAEHGRQRFAAYADRHIAQAQVKLGQPLVTDPPNDPSADPEAAK